MSRRLWLPPLLWAAIILLLTSIPVPDRVYVPGGDKTAHVLMYGILGLLAARSALRAGWAPARLALLLLGIAAFAAIDEAHQMLIPGRFADRLDWYADIIGATLGLAAGLVAFGTGERAT